MASANSTFTEMVTTTLREHPSMIADNVSDNNALYRKLKIKKKIDVIDGGYEIVEPLDYAENSTYTRYSGYDLLGIGASDVLSAAKYDWVQAAVNVVASGRELRMNSGKNQIIKLTKARITNAMRTAANNMSVDLYSDGLLTNQMGGLAHQITTDGTGTVGGIVAGTFTFWKNQFKEAQGTNSFTFSTLKQDMNDLWMACTRGTDKPDLIVSSHDLFAIYWAGLQDLQRYTNSDNEATTGFQSLKYVTADFIFDSNTNFGTTAQKMYFLNTDYMRIVAHQSANWTQGEEKTSTNQDAVVIPILWMGNLVCSNRSLQGVLFDAA